MEAFKRSLTPCSAIRERFAEYVSGTLPETECDDVRAHVARCRDCQRELLLEEQVAAAVIETEAGQAEPRRQGILLIAAADLDWEDTDITGVRRKLLHRDEQTGASTELLRVTAGSRLNAHQHAALEEVFLISGQLLIENREVTAGAYCRVAKGIEHGELMALTDAELLLCHRAESSMLDSI
jgi:anti-sigma factor ChrR (cupin superfamily)